MANPITECDRVRSYAAPDPPLWAVGAARDVRLDAALNGHYGSQVEGGIKRNAYCGTTVSLHAA
jgi:hypothetical protein